MQRESRTLVYHRDDKLVLLLVIPAKVRSHSHSHSIAITAIMIE